MKLLCTASTLAMIGMSAPVLAFDIGGGFMLTGNLEYEHLSVGSSDFSAGFLDADLSYQHSSGFGAFVGIDAISADGLDADTFYGALTYSGNFGKIQIGAPRSALNDYIDAPAVGGLDVLDLQLSQLTGSILPVALLSSSETALGLRYDGSFGAASVGASVHDINGLKVFGLGVNYSMGQTKLMAGIEHLKDDGLSATSYFLGAEHDFGQVTAGAILSTVEIVGDAQTAQVYAVYSPTDRLDLTASLLHADTGFDSGEFYGLAATFDLNEAVYLEGGFASGDLFGGTQDIYGVSLGVNF